jgi:hypothetical protein
MYKYVVAKSKNGVEVYVDLISSSAGHYLSRQPYVIGLISEVISPMRLTDPEIRIEQDMGRVIGNSDVVKTSDKDTVFYAKPPKKTVFSRYVKNRAMSPSDKLTIALDQDTDGNYEILDIWIGPSKPPFPGDTKEAPDSKQYWETHALVADTQVFQPKTITKVCPY